MKKVAEEISGYMYGATGESPVSLQDLENLKISVGWTDEDEHYRHIAGEVLSDRARPLVDYWRRRNPVLHPEGRAYWFPAIGLRILRDGSCDQPYAFQSISASDRRT